MTPETILLAGVALVAVIAASVWLGHHFGTSAALAKVNGDAQQAVTWAKQEFAAPDAKPVPATSVSSWLAHPATTLRTIEHDMAQEAATVATNALAHLADATPQDANIAVQNDIKAFKAKLLADALAKLERPAAA